MAWCVCTAAGSGNWCICTTGGGGGEGDFTGPGIAALTALNFESPADDIPIREDATGELKKITVARIFGFNPADDPNSSEFATPVPVPVSVKINFSPWSSDVGQCSPAFRSRINNVPEGVFSYVSSAFGTPDGYESYFSVFQIPTTNLDWGLTLVGMVDEDTAMGLNVANQYASVLVNPSNYYTGIFPGTGDIPGIDTIEHVLDVQAGSLPSGVSGLRVAGTPAGSQPLGLVEGRFDAELFACDGTPGITGTLTLAALASLTVKGGIITGSTPL